MARLGAGLGLRQGEIFALSPGDVDFENGEVRVGCQVKLYRGNRQVFGLPKGRKTRTVPLPDAVADAVSAHVTAHPPVEVTLPWTVLARGQGNHGAAPPDLAGEEGAEPQPLQFLPGCPALERAGVPDERENSCDALRHFYASTALHEGETIKVLGGAVQPELRHGH